MNNWYNKKLGEVLNFRRGHDLSRKDMVVGNIPVVGSNGIIGYHNEYTTKSPCITIGRSGNVGLPYRVKKDCWAHNTTLYIDDFKGNDPEFIYYFLHTLNLDNYRGGSAVPTLNRNHIHPIDVRVPDFPTQRRIVGILSALDDKIENNRKICETLEQIAQAIFKRWFVDFDFPDEQGLPYKSSGGKMIESELGMIPEGWGIGNIGNYAKVKSGFAFKSQWWQEDGISVVKIKSIQNQTINLNEVGYVSEDKISLAKEFLVTGGDFLIAMTGATIGKMGIVPETESPILVNQRVGKFFLGDDPYAKISYLYCLLNQKKIYEKIVGRGDGSAQPNVSPTQIESIVTTQPTNELINKFNKTLRVNFEIWVKLLKENEILQQTRDTLLPKLMSGEVEV
jgi:type I restriction enzyme S subunit